MIVQLKDIYKNYDTEGSKLPVLRNINMEVEKGDYIAIMGPSGSGKTTLMNTLGCLDVPSSGSYHLDGRDLSGCTDDELAEIRNKYIGFVFQSFHLLPRMTALDNVALPLLYADVPLKERRERAQKALEVVGLADRVGFFPNQLSGGQCQRVAIARAIVSDPTLLLADEPTGALDMAAGAQIMDIFRQLNDNGVTIMVITHEQMVADCTNRIYRLLDGRLGGGELTENGKLVAEGRRDEVAAFGEREGIFIKDEVQAPEEAAAIEAPVEAPAEEANING